MPGRGGLEILPEIKKIQPSTIVIIITAYASVESAIQAMKIGAYDYVQKPFKHGDLLLTIQRALAHKTLLDENDRLREELRKKFSFSNILGRSRPMERVFELIKAAAPTRSTILVQGESGTESELGRPGHPHQLAPGFLPVHRRQQRRPSAGPPRKPPFRTREGGVHGSGLGETRAV